MCTIAMVRIMCKLKVNARRREAPHHSIANAVRVSSSLCTNQCYMLPPPKSGYNGARWGFD